MGIKEEIFDEFFKKLNEDKGIPDFIVEELKGLLENDSLLSEEIILKILERGIKNDC